MTQVNGSNLTASAVLGGAVEAIAFRNTEERCVLGIHKPSCLQVLHPSHPLVLSGGVEEESATVFQFQCERERLGHSLRLLVEALCDTTEARCLALLQGLAVAACSLSGLEEEKALFVQDSEELLPLLLGPHE